MSSREVTVVENGYWQFDGKRCERADAPARGHPFFFLASPLPDAAPLLLIHDCDVDGARVAVLFADFGSIGLGLDAAQRASAASIISRALDGAIVACMFSSPREGRVLIECHPHSLLALRPAAIAATYCQYIGSFADTRRMNVNVGAVRVDILIEDSNPPRFRIAED